MPSATAAGTLSPRYKWTGPYGAPMDESPDAAAEAPLAEEWAPA